MLIEGGNLDYTLARNWHCFFRLTVLPLSMRALSQTAISPASLLNSRTWVSRSEDHLLTISSIVLPRSKDGGGTAIAEVVFVGARADVAGNKFSKESNEDVCFTY